MINFKEMWLNTIINNLIIINAVLILFKKALPTSKPLYLNTCTKQVVKLLNKMAAFISIYVHQFYIGV